MPENACTFTYVLIIYNLILNIYNFRGLQQRKLSQQARSGQETINLWYEVYDKYNSNKSLVIAHGLFASSMSWRSIAKRINEKTKHKVSRIKKPYLKFPESNGFFFYGAATGVCD